MMVVNEYILELILLIKKKMAPPVPYVSEVRTIVPVPVLVLSTNVRTVSHQYFIYG